MEDVTAAQQDVTLPLTLTLHFLSGEPTEIEVTAETTFGDVFREHGMYLYHESTKMSREMTVSEAVAFGKNQGHFLAYVCDPESEAYPDVDLVEGWFVWETTGWHWGTEVMTDICGFRGSSKLRTLTRVNMPRASDVRLRDFEALEHVNAPHALQLHLIVSFAVKNFHAPVVRDIFLRDCPSLKHLSLPTATNVELHYCSGLEALEALGAEVALVMCYSRNVTHVSAPAAKTVVIRDCPVLLRVEAPVAKAVKLVRCRKLSHVNAPAAEKVDITGCPQLPHIV